MENSIIKKLDDFCNSVFYNLFVDEYEKLCIRISSDGKNVSTDANFLESTKAFAEKEISKNAGYDVALIEKTEGVYEISPSPSDPMKFISLLDAITKKALSNWILERSLGEENSINNYSEQMDSNKNLDPNDYDVYWNVFYEQDDNRWILVIGQDEETLPDDPDWEEDVINMIEGKLPEYKFYQCMECFYEIYDSNLGNEISTDNAVKDVISKIENSFPSWKKSNINSTYC